MAYADYEFYLSEYKGNLKESDFIRLSERASDVIDSKTDFIIRKKGFGNIPEELAERIKKACCAVSESLYISERGGACGQRKGDNSRRICGRS